MTTTLAAAKAIAQALPVASALTVKKMPADTVKVPTSATATAEIVGSPSATIAVSLVDGDALALASEGSSIGVGDVLFPALSAGAAAISSGTVSIVDAPGFVDGGDLYALMSDDEVAGYIGIRVDASEIAIASNPVVGQNIGRIQDVEMQLTVVLGRTRRAVRDVLALEPGSVVELDRSAGDPADILINGHLVAHGEVVVVDQDYAVRVTRIIDTRTS